MITDTDIRQYYIELAKKHILNKKKYPSLITLDWHIQLFDKFYKGQGATPNYIDMLAATCGWNPLVLDEEMTCTIDGKKYHIKRIQ